MPPAQCRFCERPGRDELRPNVAELPELPKRMKDRDTFEPVTLGHVRENGIMGCKKARRRRRAAVGAG
jgi:hypothetical protein